MSLAVTQQSQRELDTPKLDTALAQRSLSVEPPIYSPSADADSSPENTPTTMIPSQRQLSAAPALPAKSSLRASRCLDGLLTHKLTPEGQAPFSTPHDVYLSSEEDASSSADDFSDFEFDSGSDESQSTRRGSHEDTAKVVSVVFSGKPSVIDLPRRSVSPSIISEASSRPSSRMSISSRPPSHLRRTTTLPVTLPVLDRRMSFCTTSSGSVMHPPRTSSMGTRLEKQRPDFLSIDPFAKVEPEVKEEATERPKTPKSPGVFKRTLSLVKKRSRPSLNTHFASQSKDNLSLFTPTFPMEQVREEPGTDSEERAPKPILQKAPTYHEFAQRRMSSAPMSPKSPMSEPGSPMTPNGTRSRLRQGLAAAARRRSVKV
ncbi:hypothetical protein CEK26_005768 [Fusarium fujikuroi]|nr:hypothetical protein CEK27_005772 [Fusarium fujikuroi]QGI78984.1 hypothetical protein CEK25_005713 [Fusarium fujikuroi]QGI92699.1 hypothetical protein CEK26_005768 [Fusarium fujikuroi]